MKPNNADLLFGLFLILLLSVCVWNDTLVEVWEDTEENGEVTWFGTVVQLEMKPINRCKTMRCS